MEYFGILPVDISLHIFGLLPVESVSDFALVSKSWKNLIHSPSFYKMHTVRLLRLAREAHAEIGQKLKEFKEYCEFAKQFALSCQSEELVQQFHKIRFEYVEEKMNSVRLSEQKLDYSIRLAKKMC